MDITQVLNIYKTLPDLKAKRDFLRTLPNKMIDQVAHASEMVCDEMRELRRIESLPPEKSE